MNILITGGSGLLAVNWALTMRDRYFVTLGMHRRNISLEGVQTQFIDLESVNEIVKRLDVLKPKVVIHTVGLTDIEECEANPDYARHVNVDLAQNVAIACKTIGIPLIHISTDHLFYGNMQLVDETCPVSPRNIYARTKADAEYVVQNANPLSIVVRTNFYGWGPYYRRSFSDRIIDALRSNKKIILFEDVYYTPLLIEFLVDTAHELLDKKIYGVFNIVGDERVSKYQFGMKIAKIFNLDSTLIQSGLSSDMSSRVQRPSDISLSNKYITTILDRQLGGLDEQLTKLFQQEKSGFIREILK